MKKLMLLMMLTATLGACSSLAPVKVPTQNTFTLTAANQKQLTTKPTALTLLINAPQSNTAYQTTKMVYAEKPYQLQYFAYNRWITAPNEMLQPLLLQSFRNSNYFRAVVGAPFYSFTSLRLDSQLIDFKQQFLANHSQFQMKLQITLSNNTNNRILFSKLFQASISANANPQAGVIAANQATQQILQDAVSATITYLNKNPLKNP